MRREPATHLLNVADVAGDRHVIAVSAGPSADLVILSLEQEPDYRMRHPSGVTAAKKWVSRPNQFRIHHQTDWGFDTIDLPETYENYYYAQPIGTDRWLLVRGRAYGEADKNAHIYSSTGQLIRSFHAGDGIEDVQTTEDGQVWVSYFDEGVFGDSELGSSGVVQLNELGESLFQYNGLIKDVLPIDDCYAMNVASRHEVWLYYYSHFPLVRLRDCKLDRQWHDIPVAGAHAFAAMDNRALFAGGYEKKGRLFLVTLDSMNVEEVEPQGDNGEAIRFTSAIGRGPRLYLIDERDDIFMLDVRTWKV